MGGLERVLGVGREVAVGGAQRLRSVGVQMHEHVLARDRVRSVEVEALEEKVQLVVQGRLRRCERENTTRKVLE